MSEQDYDSIFLLDIKGFEFEKNKFNFPFKVALSFGKLIEHIKSIAASEDVSKAAYAKLVLEELKSYPELSQPIFDFKLDGKYKKIISDMMMFIFPNAFWDKQTYAAAHPFFSEIFYSSPRFNEIVKIIDGEIQGQLNIDSASYNFGRAVSGFAAILGAFYGLNLRFEFPLVYKIPDPESGLDRYFKLNMANEFLDVVALKKPPPLSEKDLCDIRENIYDLDFLKKMITAENFVFHGFLVINLIDITDTEILSSIKHDLIKKETITTYTGFLKLQHALKSLLKCPGLLLGLTDCKGCSEIMFDISTKFGNSFLISDCCDIEPESIKNSSYEYSYQTKKVVIIENLEKFPNKTIVEERILKKGIKNLLIAPLIYGDEIVGMIELGSPSVGMISKMNTLKLREVLPIFAMAVARSKDETNNKIQAIIKEKCTAIHPSLEWKFRNAAVKLMRSESEGVHEEMEEIVFNEVYPLYGLSDVRNSSVLRNNAIKQDLIENLEMAKEVIEIANKHKGLHSFDEMTFRINKKIDLLNFSVNSGDESQTLSFLNKQIIPTFEYIKNYSSDVKKIVDKYYDVLDRRLGFVYKKRKQFDESITKLSDVIAGYIDEEQIKIQKIYPHYFERFKSDGVDHNIYIGASLSENGIFNKLYLRNIRLWQLLIICGSVRKSVEIKSKLSLPLETAHLVLVQSNPLSIRFRFDEKKFDIDGAYNVRYEIMKKRIDKAEIKGKEERLTQPEKIAIVYSQSDESQEYAEYIEYLQSRNFLKKKIEELELEELQGVKGLKALRVSVNVDNKSLGNPIDNQEIKIAVDKMSVN